MRIVGIELFNVIVYFLEHMISNGLHLTLKIRSRLIISY